jgi:hypothetical protein
MRRLCLTCVIRKLLSAEDRVLRSFSYAEFNDLLSFDLDGFASCRVATEASLALYENELTETRKREGVLRVLVSKLSDAFENRYSLFFAELILFSDGSSDLGFGEGFGHRYYLLGAVLRFYLLAMYANKTSEK